MCELFYITSVGWEPRFHLALADLLTERKPSKAILLHPQENASRAAECLTTSINHLKAASVPYSVVKIKCSDHVGLWDTLHTVISTLPKQSEVILDITTMPRHVIWCALHHLESLGVKVECIYYPPIAYGDWLTRDPGKPRMMYRHSGISEPNLPTCLAIFAGFDSERVCQLVRAFDPTKILLICQKGDQFNNSQRVALLSEDLRYESIAEKITLDAYSVGLEDELTELIGNYRHKFNVVATSFGPKPSAVALYMLNRKLPDVGLVYAVAKSYSDDYSHGINTSKCYSLTLNFATRH